MGDLSLSLALGPCFCIRAQPCLLPSPQVLHAFFASSNGDHGHDSRALLLLTPICKHLPTKTSRIAGCVCLQVVGRRSRFRIRSLTIIHRIDKRNLKLRRSFTASSFCGSERLLNRGRKETSPPSFAQSHVAAASFSHLCHPSPIAP